MPPRLACRGCARSARQGRRKSRFHSKRLAVLRFDPPPNVNMRKKMDPRLLPNYSDRRVVDQQLAALDVHGLSRREFLQLASASAVASATALAFGIPSVAVAEPTGK